MLLGSFGIERWGISYVDGLEKKKKKIRAIRIRD
jgi:hypothetical protein